MFMDKNAMATQDERLILTKNFRKLCADGPI